MPLNKFFRISSMLALLMLILSGCRTLETDVGNSNEASKKRITVIDNPEKTTYEDSVVNALVRLDDVRGMDWLSEEEIIVDKENRHVGAPEKADGLEWYPHNLYLHSLQSGIETPLFPANEYQGFAQLNPDRTRVFYKTFSMQSNTGKGFLYDFHSRKNQAFTETDAIDVQSGSWVDNDTIVYATIDGNIYLSSMDKSPPRLLLDSQNSSVHDLAYMNDQLYYSSWLDGSIFVKGADEEPRALGVSNVVWMVPSPDEQRLAIVRKMKSGERELLITDLNGQTLLNIAQDTQIFGAAWSPDGKKLAYAGLSPNGTVSGIYVADTLTGISDKLSVDIKFISDKLHWSPTGNRLMIATHQPVEQSSVNRAVTYLVRVSGT